MIDWAKDNPGTAIGLGTLALGAYSSIKSDEASKRAAELQQQSIAQATEASDAQLLFQQSMYDEWKATYGDFETNLRNYYSSMTPQNIEALGIQNVEMEYNRATTELQKNLAQRGLTNSGAAAQGLTQLEQSRAQERTRVREEAPRMAAQEQMGFLGLGMGMESGLQSGISQAYANQSSMLAQQSGLYAQQASTAQVAQQQALTGTGSALGTLYGTHLMSEAMKTNPNAKVVYP